MYVLCVCVGGGAGGLLGFTFFFTSKSMSHIINSSHDELANLNVPVQTHTVILKCSFSSLF